ncbi:MAG: peptide-N-glycosidase F-related protein [Myxococcales bacterium]
MRHFSLALLVLLCACDNGASSTRADASLPADAAARPADAAGVDAALPADAAQPADAETPPDAAEEPLDAASPPDTGVAIGADLTVTAFDQTPLYFTGSDNQRTVDRTASFPTTGAYSRILLHLTLACPAGGCDPWDRLGWIAAVTSRGQNGAPDTLVELARFITPFHVGMSVDVDVTDLRPLLSGDLTLRAFIDTWVGPGSPYGDGWLLTASFELTGGVPARIPAAVIPVWQVALVVYGDPAKPIAGSAPAQKVSLPAGATSYALRTLVTGHGQGNADNCAEFCSRDHSLAFTAPHTHQVWRDDCATTAAPNQQGTYRYSRAGWCPGADVRPWIEDVTADLAGLSEATLAYDVEAYENTCRPDASECTGCTLGTACDYDGGAHTEPFYLLSSTLIAYW